MQVIETIYHGVTNTRPARITAAQSGGPTKATISRDGAPGDDNEAHAMAARALAQKLNWRGEMVGGHTRDGMVWVFLDPASPRVQL